MHIVSTTVTHSYTKSMTRLESSNKKPSDEEQRLMDIAQYEDQIYYSSRYSDDTHEYRHVVLPKQMVRWIPQGRLMAEQEWRSLGVKQSPGWKQIHKTDPEPHILLFRRDKEPTGTTGGLVG